MDETMAPGKQLAVVAFKRPWSIVLPVAILLLAAALRFVALNDLPPGLFFDESANGVDALRVLGGWHPVFFPSDQGREPLFIYLQAAAMALIGPSAFALRLPAAFLGVATVAATYATFRSIAGETVGVIGAGLLATSFWHVSLSRLAFRTISMPLFLILGVFFLWKGIRSGHLWSFAAGGTCVAIAFYTYIPARLAPVLLGTWLVGCLLVPSWRGRTRVKTIALGSAIALAACVVVALPLADYFYLHPHDFIERVRNVVAPAPTRTTFDGFARTLSGLFVIGDPNVRHDLPGRPLVDLSVAMLGVVGAVVGRRQWRDGSGLLILAWCVAMLTPAALTDEPAHALRLAGELPFVLFFPAIGLAWIASRRPGGHPAIGPAVAGLLVCAAAFVTARDYFVDWPRAPGVNHVFQAELLDSLQLLRSVPVNAPVFVSSDVYDGVAIPIAFVPHDGARAFKGQDVFVVPARQTEPVYYVYPLSFEPSNRPNVLGQLIRVASSVDDVGQADGELLRFDSPARLPASGHPAEARIGAAVVVTGTDITSWVKPGDTATYALHWTVQGKLPPGNWDFFAHLVDRDQHRLLASAYNHAFPPDQWRTGDNVVSWFDLRVPASAPPGVADVDLGLFDNDTGQRLPVTALGGDPAGTALIVGPVRIASPIVTPPLPQYAVSVRFGSNFSLVGYDVDRPANGDVVVRLHWQAILPTTTDYTIFIHLLDASGKLIDGADSQPGNGSLPTSTWQPGELIVDEHRIPAGSEAHATTLEVGAYLLSTGERLGPVVITGDTGKSVGDALRLPW